MLREWIFNQDKSPIKEKNHCHLLAKGGVEWRSISPKTSFNRSLLSSALITDLPFQVAFVGKGAKFSLQISLYRFDCYVQMQSMDPSNPRVGNEMK